MSATSSPYYGPAVAAATRYGVPADLFTAQIDAESGFNPNAYNPSSGATGIAQFLPSTANQAGYGISAFDPMDPLASLDAAARYDAALFSRTGSWERALSAYSGSGAATPYAGSDAVQAALAGAGNSGFHVPSWDELQQGFMEGLGGGIFSMFGNPFGSLFGDAANSVANGVSKDGGISIIDALKRGGLFVVALIFIAVGLAMFALSTDTGKAVAKAAVKAV